MKHVSNLLLVLALALGSACGSDTKKNTTDTLVEDTANQPDLPGEDLVDTDVPGRQDLMIDLQDDVPVVPDTKPEDTNKPDVVEDTNPQDTQLPDTQEDVAKPDVVEEVETVEDVVDPNACGYGENVAGLMKCTEGPVDAWLKGAVVTYAFDKGFFIHDGSTDRGMEIYLPAGEVTLPKAGDVVDCHVLEWGNFMGQQEVTKIEACTKVGDADPTDSALELVAGNVAPGEANESRLVYGNGLTVVQLNDKDAVVAYGSQTGIAVRLDTPGELCVGATFNLLRGVITQYDQSHRIQVFVSATDVQSINTTNCGAEPAFDDSNWGFEEAGFDNPPADFLNATMAMTSNRDTTTAHSGAASCKLTWTSTTNQDFLQGYYVPATEGQKATLSVWVSDQAEGGRVRLGITFYKADKTNAANTFYSADYSVNQAGWQQLTWEAVAPVDTAFVRGVVRLYDDGAAWNGSAFVNVDDWSLTVQ